MHQNRNLQPGRLDLCQTARIKIGVTGVNIGSALRQVARQHMAQAKAGAARNRKAAQGGFGMATLRIVAPRDAADQVAAQIKRTVAQRDHASAVDQQIAKRAAQQAKGRRFT